LYNHKCLHTALGGNTPLQAMKDWPKIKIDLSKNCHIIYRDVKVAPDVVQLTGAAQNTKPVNLRAPGLFKDPLK